MIWVWRILGAVGLLGTGVVAGAAMRGASNESEKRAAYDEGMEKGKAEAAARMRELQAKIERAAARHADQKKLHEFYVNAAAIGFAMAGCDGTVRVAEKECIREFIAGISKHLIPNDIQELLDNLCLTPPDFDGAMLYAERLGSDNWAFIDDILTVVGEADGDGYEHERDFLLKWQAYKAAQFEGVPA